MLDFPKVLEYLLKNELTMEEFFLLLFIHNREQYPSDNLVGRGIDYYKKNKYYTFPNEKQVAIMWVEIINSLSLRGFLDDYRTSKEKDANMVDLSKLIVTEKFKRGFIGEKGIDEVWEDFVYLYKKHSYKDENGICKLTSDQKTSIFQPDKGNKELDQVEKFKDYMWKVHCKNGQQAEVSKFIILTEEYLESTGAEQKISTWLNGGYSAYLMSK